MLRNLGINVRVTAQEKEKLKRKSERCGLSLSEYLRQTSLGHSPKELPPIEYHKVISMLSDLYSKSMGDEGKTEIVETLKIIQSEFTGGGHI